MAGWSASRAPKALRCRACQIASDTDCRMPAVVPSTQSSRVWLTISMMVGTPRPGSPTRTAQVPSNSTSEEAFDLLPSLFFSRWIRTVLRVPSASTRGTRKQVSPASAWASTRKASDCGAEKNHL